MMEKVIKFMTAAGILIGGFGEMLRQLNLYNHSNPSIPKKDENNKINDYECGTPPKKE